MKGQVHFIDNNKKVKKLPINHLKFKRELIVDISTERFCDSDPCIIHQTYCNNYLAEQLRITIDTEYPELVDTELNITELPKNIIDQLDENQFKGISSIKFM